MKHKITLLVVACLTARAGNVSAATVTVTQADDGVSNIGAAGTFYWALTNCNPGDTIAFNIPGSGPHYLKPPPGGFPLVYQKHNLTIDGYTQPGSSVNTKPITETNNAVIKIVLDGRGQPKANYRDMAYVYYGTMTTPVPPIDNSSMWNATSSLRERGGYDPESADPYAPGEVALLGIYRSTNVTVKGLAFLGDGPAGGFYCLAVAQDYGLDTTVRDRLAYDNGTSRGFHVAGCWFGLDPGTGQEAGNDAGLTLFRHRDKSSGGTRPELPNGEGFCIGVKPGAANPRAEFNVFAGQALAIGAEAVRTRVSGNQFLISQAGGVPEFGRYDDVQSPSLLFGTDGDGVNDADEGNLFVAYASFYNTAAKHIVFAGNTFGLERDGSRPNLGFAVDTLRFDQGTRVRFGSDLNGVSDALEANKVYDGLFGVNVGGSAPVNGSWFSMRGNALVNCTTPPIAGSFLTYFDKFMDASMTAKPTIDPTSTVSLLKGTCSTNKPAYPRVYIDLYIADPEGDLRADPQGSSYLATFEDNGPADGDADPGEFSFNIASLGLAAGTRVTLTANYANDSKPQITSVSAPSGGTVTLGIAGGIAPYQIQRASSLTGPWSLVGQATAPGSVVVAAGGSEAFYRVAAMPVALQTSPFADSVALNPISVP